MIEKNKGTAQDNCSVQLHSLSLDKVSFTWPNGTKALDQCSFDISRPGLWMIVGRNGSGKSTLFRLISGMIKHQSGRLKCSYKSALMFQNPDHHLLLPSCGSDLLLNAPKNQSIAQVKAKINSALCQVGMEGMEQRPIHTLSGGQKQRLALALAICKNPSILLLDEPTASADPQTTFMIEKILTEEFSLGRKLILVTHDIAQAKRLGQDIIFIYKGKIIEHSNAKSFFKKPEKKESEQFLSGEITL